MSQSILCPHCQRQLSVSPELAGKQIACPQCKGVFVAPAIGPPVSPPESSPFDFLSPSTSAKPVSRLYHPVRRKKTPVNFLRVGVTVALIVVFVVTCLAVKDYIDGRKRADASHKEIEAIEKQDAAMEANQRKQRLADEERERQKAIETEKRIREGYYELYTSNHGGDSIDKATAILGKPSRRTESEVGDDSYIHCTWRGRFTTVDIDFKHFSKDEIHDESGYYAVLASRY